MKIKDAKVLYLESSRNAKVALQRPDELVDAILRKRRNLTTMRNAEYIWPSLRNSCDQLAAWLTDVIPADQPYRNLLDKCITNACDSADVALKKRPFLTDSQLAVAFLMALLEHTPEADHWDFRAHNGRHWRVMGNEPLLVFRSRHGILRIIPKLLSRKRPPLDPGMLRMIIASRILAPSDLELLGNVLKSGVYRS